MAQSVGEIALDIVMGKNTVSSVAKQAMTDVQKTFNDGSATVTDKTKAIGQAFTSVGASMAPMSLAAQGFVATSTNAAVSFETSMAQVKTIAGDAAVSYKGDMMDMSEAILKLSSDSGIAAEDIALATYGAISAGVDVSKSVEFVATANALAVGGFTEMSTSVDVLTTVMNAYGDKAGSAQSISDKLITTQNLGKTTVDELASSMGKVIPTASAYNVSIDNLCASYVAMTKGGIATAEATTYTKSMLNELADSGSTVGKVLQEQTGKSFGQLMNEGYSLADVIDILGQSVDGDKEKFAQLFGSAEAGTGALAILNGGTKDFNATLDEMKNSTGAASTAMNQMNDTSAHKMQVAMNDMKLAAIELGGAFAPVMSGIASVISTVARAFSNLPGPVQTVIAVLLGVVAVASPVLLAVGGIISIVGSLTSAVGLISGALGTFTGFLSGTVMPAIGGFFTFLAANPIILIIGAIIGVGALLITHWEEVKQVADFVWNGICDIFSFVGDFIKGAVEGAFTFISDTVTNISNGVKTFVSDTWNGIKNTVSNVCTGIKNTASTAWNNTKNAVSTACNNIKNTASTAWNNTKSAVSTACSNIKTTASTAWNNTKLAVSNACSNIKTSATNAWNNITNSINSKSSAIKNAVTNCFNGARDKIKGFASQAIGWGKDFANGLAKGIKDAAGKVIDAAKGLGNKIREFLHFSRPDKGPLRDYETWMPDFVKGMANGLESSKGKLVNSIKNLSGDMKITLPTQDFNKDVVNTEKAISKIANAGKNIIKDARSGQKETGIADIIEEATNLAIAKVETAKNTVDTTLQNCNESVGQFENDTYVSGGDVANSFADGIYANSGRVSSAINDVSGICTDSLSSLVNKCYAYGSDFINCIVNGINANMPKLIAVMANVAKTMSTPAMSMVPAMNAPTLQNVGSNKANSTASVADTKLYELINKLATSMQNAGNITVPVYLGNDLLDEQIIRADDRRTVRSGGRA